MASMWRKAMLYLGLGPDEEYDDFDVTGEHQRQVQPRPVVRRSGDAQHDPEPSGSVRTLSPSSDHADGHATGRNGHERAQDRPHENGRSPSSARATERSGESLRPSARVATAAGERAGRERGATVRPLPSAAGSSRSWSGPARSTTPRRSPTSSR